MRIAEVSLSTHQLLQIITTRVNGSIQGKSRGKNSEYTLVQIELKVAAQIHVQLAIIN